MCVTINSFAVFILLFVSLHLALLADGLPLLRRERGTEDDIIAGKDFLNVLMDLSALENLETSTIHPLAPPVTLPTSIHLEHYSETLAPVLRQTRSTHFTSSIQKPTSNAALMPTQPIGDISTLMPKSPSDSSDRRIVSVSISSSVEERHRIYSPKTSSTTEAVKISTTTPNDNYENVYLSVEDRQGFVAAANKHEFSVEEREPITKDSEPHLAEELPANVQAIPVIKKLSDFEKTSELLKELSQEKLKDKLPPFHHTVIYHNNPNEQMAARSISYSTVIQTVPGENVVRRWKGRSNKQQDAKPTQNSMSEYSSPEYDESLEKNKENSDWETSESTTGSHMEPTERNWGMQQNAYTPKQNVPLIYGQSEENYEVDEAVSVQTNGRIHGVQPSQSTEEQKPTANSKNGYVIEGRKERRYRVEERTPDGFIVGEFGILNRDDGLLRGVRYTAEETINPKLIYDTLMKFLSL